MASVNVGWALDQAVNAPPTPHLAIDSPLGTAVKGLLGFSKTLLPWKGAWRVEEAEPSLIHSFNMLICPRLLQSLPGWTLQKETVFQTGDVFFKHSNWKQMNPSIKFTVQCERGWPNRKSNFLEGEGGEGEERKKIVTTTKTKSRKFETF